MCVVVVFCFNTINQLYHDIVYLGFLPTPDFYKPKQTKARSSSFTHSYANSGKILSKEYFLGQFFTYAAASISFIKLISTDYLAATFPFSSLLFLCSFSALSSSSSLSRSRISSSLSSSFCLASASCRTLSSRLSSSRRTCSFSALILQ